MRLLVGLLAAVALATGCATGAVEQDRATLTQSSARGGSTARHVLLVSVDGLNPRAIAELGPAGAPAFHRLMREGASTLNARTLYEETETLPNHTSMVTGRRAALPGGHGVRFNYDNGATLRQVAGHYVAGTFDVVHDHGGRTAMFAAKDRFRLLDRSWNARNGAPDRVGLDSGRDKVDRFVLAPYDDQALVAAVVRELTTRPRALTFLHLGEPDRVGHEHGGMSAAYLDAVRRTDALLGRILRVIAARPSLSQELVLVLTSDHGTNKRHHDAARRLANYRVPFFAWGAGVAAGANLYALNPHRQPPGRTRPAYDGPQPIRNGDAANLVTAVLGLPPVRGSELGAPRTLDLR